MTSATPLVSEVSVDQLSRNEWITVMWGFAWRGIVATLLSGVVGAALGFVIGFLFSMISSGLGMRPDALETPLHVTTAIVGLLVGLYFFLFYLRWLLIRMPIVPYVASLGRPLLYGALMGLCVEALALPLAGLAAPVRVALLAAFGAAVYGALLWLRERPLLVRAWES